MADASFTIFIFFFMESFLFYNKEIRLCILKIMYILIYFSVKYEKEVFECVIPDLLQLLNSK